MIILRLVIQKRQMDNIPFASVSSDHISPLCLQYALRLAFHLEYSSYAFSSSELKCPLAFAFCSTFSWIKNQRDGGLGNVKALHLAGLRIPWCVKVHLDRAKLYRNAGNVLTIAAQKVIRSRQQHSPATYAGVHDRLSLHYFWIAFPMHHLHHHLCDVKRGRIITQSSFVALSRLMLRRFER